MKKLLTLIPLTFIACSTPEPKQADTPAAVPPIAVETPEPVDNSLSDINATIFTCAKAALNSAAREVKAAPSQGSYQFSYFRIVTNSHHALYEVHFKSNVYDEPELKYCVSVYCQQGLDPNTAKTTVRLISDSELSNTDAKHSTHEANCGHELPTPAATKKTKLKR